jgi:hypothetical protein
MSIQLAKLFGQIGKVRVHFLAVVARKTISIYARRPNGGMGFAVEGIEKKRN